MHPRTRDPEPDPQLAQRGIIDTSAVINLEQLEAGHLPVELAAAAITVGELAASPLATGAADERALRPDRHHREEVDFDPVPFDGEAARAHGRLHATEIASGRKARGPGAPYRLIAATARAANLPLDARNQEDLRGPQWLVEAIAA